MHVCIFESSKLEGLYVGDSLYTGIVSLPAHSLLPLLVCQCLSCLPAPSTQTLRCPRCLCGGRETWPQRGAVLSVCLCRSVVPFPPEMGDSAAIRRVEGRSLLRFPKHPYFVFNQDGRVSHFSDYP